MGSFLQTILQIEKAVKNKQIGFTLVELMVTLAVGVTILGIGVPAFSGMMTSNRATGYVNDLIGALRLARSEAVKRGAGVTVCASNAANNACEGSNWQNGWLVFTDPDNDHTYNAEDDTLIRVWQGMKEGATFVGAADEAASYEAAPSYIRFLASGEVSSAVNEFAFTLNGCTGTQARNITVSKMGRANVKHTTCF